MLFADLALSRRLERAEGRACVQFAEARRRIFPESGAAWFECSGALAVFDQIDSPVTQSFGLGLFEKIRLDSLERIEGFFLERGAPVFHEVSPFAGVATLELLCIRKYRPIEVSTVLYRPVDTDIAGGGHDNIKVRVVGLEEAQLWAQISARGWSHDHPELNDFLAQFGLLLAARSESVCFLAEIDGVPAAAGAVCMNEGVALFAGAATVPEQRRKGLQAALLEARMRYASEHGCDLAMMVAETGSDSQRNAERKGFRIAYTRTKWRLQA